MLVYEGDDNCLGAVGDEENLDKILLKVFNRFLRGNII